MFQNIFFRPPDLEDVNMNNGEMLYPWDNVKLRRPDDQKKFDCPWFDEEKKKKELPIGQDPCMHCADPNCPKIMKVYM